MLNKIEKYFCKKIFREYNKIQFDGLPTVSYFDVYAEIIKNEYDIKGDTYKVLFNTNNGFLTLKITLKTLKSLYKFEKTKIILKQYEKNINIDEYDLIITDKNEFLETDCKILIEPCQLNTRFHIEDTRYWKEKDYINSLRKDKLERILK